VQSTDKHDLMAMDWMHRAIRK